MLTEEKWNDIETRLEHTQRKLLKRLAPKTGMSKSSAKTTTQWPKLRPYKATVIRALQLHNPAKRVHFCRWFLQFVVECDINPSMIVFSDKAWFHFQRHITMQNNNIIMK